MFQNMGIWDWGIILMIVLLLFGSNRLPDLAKSLGRSLASFKQGLKDGERELHENLENKSDSGAKPGV